MNPSVGVLAIRKKWHNGDKLPFLAPFHAPQPDAGSVGAAGSTIRNAAP